MEFWSGSGYRVSCIPELFHYVHTLIMENGLKRSVGSTGSQAIARLGRNGIRRMNKMEGRNEGIYSSVQYIYGKK